MYTLAQVKIVGEKNESAAICQIAPDVCTARNMQQKSHLPLCLSA